MRSIVLVAGLAVALVGCGGETRDDWSRTRSSNAHGLAIELPMGWNGRIVRESPAQAIVLQAATVPLAPVGAPPSKTHEAMNDDDLYIEIDDIGPPPPRLTEVDPAWEEGDLPLSIDRQSVHDLFEGVRLPAYAARAVVVRGRSLMLYVGFGSKLSDAALKRVNRVLATVRVEPGSFLRAL